MENFVEKWHPNWKKFLLTLLLLEAIETASSPVKIQPETDDFQTLIIDSSLYADKTLLIEEYFKLYSQNTSALLLVHRPEGWAKTTNMKMLEKFLEIEVDHQGNPLPEEETLNDYLFLGGPIDDIQFTPLKISNSPIALPHLGQHPVILLSLKNAIGTTYQEIVQGIKSCVMETYKKHEYLSNSMKITDKSRLENYLAGEFDETGLITSIYFLSRKLYEHFGKKVHILIDDYDLPFVSASLNNYTVDYNEIEKLFKNLFDNSLTKNQFRSIVLMNGVHPVNIIWNYCTYYLADSPLIQFYGFCQTEVDKLIKDSEIQVNPEELKYWYGGYYVNGKNDHYNARSVMRCLAQNGTIAYYGPAITLDTCEIDSYEYDYSTDETTNYCNQSDIFTLSTGKILLKNVHSIIHILMTSNQLKSSQCPYSNISFEDHSSHSSWFDEHLKEKSALIYHGFLTMDQKLLFDEDDIILPISPFGSPTTSTQINAEELLVLQELQLQYLEYLIPNYEMTYFYQTIALQWICHMFEISEADFFSFVQLILVNQTHEVFKGLDNYLDNPKIISYLESEGITSELEFYNAFMMSLELVLSSTHTIMYKADHTDICNESVYGRDMIFIPKSNQSMTIIITFDILDKFEGNFSFNDVNDELSSPECSADFGYVVQNGIDRIESIIERNNLDNENHIKISWAFCGRSMAIQHMATSLSPYISDFSIRPRPFRFEYILDEYYQTVRFGLNSKNEIIGYN